MSPDSGLSSNDGVRVASASGVAGAWKAAPKPAPKSLLWPEAARPKVKAAPKTLLPGPPKPNRIFMKPDNPDLAPVTTIIEDNGTTIPCRWCNRIWHGWRGVKKNIEYDYERCCNIQAILPLGITPPPLVYHLSCCSGCYEGFLVETCSRCTTSGCSSTGRTSSPSRGGEGLTTPSSFPIIVAARAASVQAA